MKTPHSPDRAPVRAMAAPGKPAPRPGFRSWRRLAACTRGASAVEFGIILPAFLLLTGAAFEFSYMMMLQALLDGGVREASRFGTTGRTLGETSRADQIAQIVEAGGLGLIDAQEIEVETFVFESFDTIQREEPFEDSNGNGRYDAGENFTDINGNGSWDDTTGTAGVGGAEDIVLYDVKYEYDAVIPIFAPMFPPDGVVRLGASIAIRNEPYPSE